MQPRISEVTQSGPKTKLCCVFSISWAMFAQLRTRAVSAEEILSHLLARVPEESRDPLSNPVLHPPDGASLTADGGVPVGVAVGVAVAH